MSTKKAQTKKIKYKKNSKTLDEEEKQRLFKLSLFLNTLSSLSKTNNTIMPKFNMPVIPAHQQHPQSKYNVPEKVWALDYDYMTFADKKQQQTLALKSPHKKTQNQLSKKNPYKIKKGLRQQGRGGKRTMKIKNRK
jgi:hypothetical protein